MRERGEEWEERDTGEEQSPFVVLLLKKVGTFR